MASQNVLALTDESFDSQVLSPGTVAVVDFWAAWCMPCKMLAPVIDDLANEYAGRVTVAKVDTDSCRDTAIKYGISSIPTVIIFKNGEMRKKFVGLQQKADLRSAIEEVLESD